MNEKILAIAIVLAVLLALSELVPRPCDENDYDCYLEMRGELYLPEIPDN